MGTKVRYQVVLETKIRDKAQEVSENFGLNLSDAIRMFVYQIAEGRIRPTFQPQEEILSEEEDKELNRLWKRFQRAKALGETKTAYSPKEFIDQLENYEED